MEDDVNDEAAAALPAPPISFRAILNETSFSYTPVKGFFLKGRKETIAYGLPVSYAICALTWIELLNLSLNFSTREISSTGENTASLISALTFCVEELSAIF